jgi:hypothetical protein
MIYVSWDLSEGTEEQQQKYQPVYAMFGRILKNEYKLWYM